jgi:ACR3 family arsenite efflux pump ArsB
MSQKNIQEYFQEYFFENFKGGRGGSGSRGKSGDKKETGKEYMVKLFIVLVIISFIFFINILFPKQTTEIFDYANVILYIIIGIIIVFIINYYISFILEKYE